MRRSWRWFALGAAVVVADQLVKLAILASFAPGALHPVTGFFNLVLVFNRGAAFSFLAGAAGWQTPVLALFAVIACVVVGFFILKTPEKRLQCIGLASILGGALGNLIDRLRFGHVVDFLDFHALGWHWPAFNVADSAITVGAALLIIEGFIHERRPGASA